MKKNVGQVGIGGLVGIGILLALGLVAYGRFHFEQKAVPQETTSTRLNDLEKKSIETQKQLDKIQDALTQIQSKTVKGEGTRPKPKKRH